MKVVVQQRGVSGSRVYSSALSARRSANGHQIFHLSKEKNGHLPSGKKNLVSISCLESYFVACPRSAYESPLINYCTYIAVPLKKYSSAQRRLSVTTAAFFGVGAPEAVLVGVVALVLFGPKGLAQAAKSIGEGIKAFAPTIRELTDISSDLKNTLEEEIGLNDIRQELQQTLSPTQESFSRYNSPIEATSSKTRTVDIEEDSDIERKRAESAKLAWSESSTTVKDVEPEGFGMEQLSLEELEAEISRRKESMKENP